MEELMTLFTQCQNLCFWLSKNTKLNVSYMFDGTNESFHINIVNNNDEEIYDNNVEKIMTKAEKVITFEMQQVINYLIQLKKQKEEELKIQV